MIGAMTENWKLIGMNHINAIVDGYEPSVEHFTERLGMDLSFRIPDSGDGTNAFLCTFGPVGMFEFFAPVERTEKGQGGLLRKFGDHYIGIEFQTPDLDLARKLAADNDVRIINDLGSAFFTYPGSSFGIAWELYDGNFHQYHKDPSYWIDEHPMALTGIDHVTVAVESVESSLARLLQLTDSTVIDDKIVRPAAAAAGVRCKVGNIEFELLEATGDGEVASYIARYGQRIRSTVWKTNSLAKVNSYLTAQGFHPEPGDADGAVRIPPAENKNLLFEFTE